MSIIVNWRRARLILWSRNCQNGRKKKCCSKREIILFSSFSVWKNLWVKTKSLVGANSLFIWFFAAKYCSQLAVIEVEGRSSSAKAVAVQYDSCRSRSSCLYAALSYIKTIVWRCVLGMGSGHWSAFWRVLIERWKEVLFCVSRISPHAESFSASKGTESSREKQE